VLALLWMTIPSLATAEGWPVRAARGSKVVAWIQDLAPQQPSRFAAWGRRISSAPYPSALGPLDTPPDPGPPPKGVLPAIYDARVRRSVVKVVGYACNQVQEGSGWVAEPGLVVTNAHVVAGEPETTVEDSDGSPHTAKVVAFDTKRDIAVLSVPDLHVAPLQQVAGKVGEAGAVYGHPEGGSLRAAPARIGEQINASGSDIYRRPGTVRQVYVIAARLHPGDSGAPLVDYKGRVMGVAFAIDPGHTSTAYAVTDREVEPVLATVGSHAVDTGRCLI
jgi:S1-C subfamily serine protease